MKEVDKKTKDSKVHGKNIMLIHMQKGTPWSAEKNNQEF